MDRYISKCEDLYMRDCNELKDIVLGHLNVVSSEVKFRFPFPNYYIKAERVKKSSRISQKDFNTKNNSNI
ncbi:MAG: hypothetical protein HQK78_07515 [Desulfobacterales bacterium]|nr:hypothetical protein [Desulfobacterales bacterium]